MKLLPSGSMSLLRGSIRSIFKSPLHQQCRTLAHSPTSPLPSSSSSPSSANLSLSNQVRLLMRRVPYPVAIITATDPTPSSPSSSKTSSNPKDQLHLSHPHAHAFRGMTVSSFNTVTLTPVPVVSFNVKRPSETLSALRASRRFLAHLLAPNRDTAALARDFSRGNQNLGVLGGRSVFGFEFVPSSESDSQLESESESKSGSGDWGLPVLRRRNRGQTSGQHPGDGGADDFPFIFECKVHDQQVDVHDHTIVFGTVVRTLVGGSSHKLDETPDEVSDLCLTYADTRFWGIGREI